MVETPRSQGPAEAGRGRVWLGLAWGVTGLVALALLAATVWLAGRVPAGQVPPVATVPPGEALPTSPPTPPPSVLPGPGAPQVAFVSDRDGRFDLYLMEAEAGALPTRLTDTRDWEYPPAWSPDGEWLAFARGPEPTGLESVRTLADFRQPMAESLHVIRADGSDERWLTDLGGWVMGLAWSPDGLRIAVHLVEDQNQNGELDDATADRSGLWVVEVASGSKTMVAGGVATWSGFAWSADSAQLLYTVGTGWPPGIFTVGVDGRGRRQLVERAAEPALSADGQWLAYVSHSLEGQSIRWRPLEGGEEAALPQREGEWQGRPRWSPDGRYLLFEAGVVDERAEMVWTRPLLFDLESETVHDFTADLGLLCLQSAWSPDGARLAFAGLRWEGSGAEARAVFPVQVYLLEVASGAVRPLTDGRSNAFGPAWRPRR